MNSFRHNMHDYNFSHYSFHNIQIMDVNLIQEFLSNSTTNFTLELHSLHLPSKKYFGVLEFQIIILKYNL